MVDTKLTQMPSFKNFEKKHGIQLYHHIRNLSGDDEDLFEFFKDSTHT